MKYPTGDNDSLGDDESENKNIQPVMSQPDSLEPEEYLSSAKYLVELLQHDMNLGGGHFDLVPARLERAINNLVALQKNYFPAPQFEITEEMAKKFYLNDGFTLNLPTQPGLYRVATKESNYMLSYVAVTMNDYRDFVAHDESGARDVRSFSSGGSVVFWKHIA